jgi:hypothetical protein
MAWLIGLFLWAYLHSGAGGRGRVMYVHYCGTQYCGSGRIRIISMVNLDLVPDTTCYCVENNFLELFTNTTSNGMKILS